MTPLYKETFLIMGCIGVINFIVHTSIMMFLLRIRVLRQKKSNQLLVNLNIGYALAGINLFATIFDKSNMLNYLTYASYAYGNAALVLLTIDRCVMIRWPFRYQSLPKYVQCFSLMASPATALVALFIGIFNDDGTASTVAMRVPAMRRAMIFTVSVFILVLFVSNLIVYLILRKQKQAISQATVASRNSNTNSKAARIRRDLTTFYICFGCVITYIILWLPELIRHSIWYVNGVHIEGATQNITVVILNLNPCCDAFVLVFFNKELKSHLKDLISRRAQRRQVKVIAQNKD